MTMRAIVLLLAVMACTVRSQTWEFSFEAYSQQDCTGSDASALTYNVNTCETISGIYVKFTTTSSSCSNGASVNYVVYSGSSCTGSSSTSTTYTIGTCNGGYKLVCGGGSNSCFPSNATVELEQGTTKRMDELAVGDRVRTGPNTFSDIYVFGHDDADATSLFHILTTASGHQLALSPKHYVHVMPDNTLVQARNIRVGHVLQLANGTASPILSIATDRRNGLYNPHTLDGKIVVDGVLASCYTGTIEPTVAHALLWPLRALYNVGVRVFDSLPANEGLRAAVVSMLPQGK